MLAFDDFGRILYNPEFHKRHCKPWTKEEVDYLVNWYMRIGAEEMSFALERPEASIMQKVTHLRKKGVKIGTPEQKREIPREINYYKKNKPEGSSKIV